MKEIKEITTRYTFAENLTHLFNASIKENVPFAIWRQPQEENIQAICQIASKKINIEELENAPKGFMVNPFKKGEQGERNFILSEIELSQDTNEIKINPAPHATQEELERFYNGIEETRKEEKFSFTNYLHNIPEFTSEKEEFVDLVEKCKKDIREGYYQKIVPARRYNYGLKRGFHPILEFFKLCERYENAFVSIVYMPESGLWIGATPELLIATEEKRYFHTVSLAGTQEIPRDFDLARAAWRQKEIEEQALVSRYIVNCFKQIRLREFEEKGPYTAKAGNLIHLKTSFKVDMEKTNFPELATIMLNLLHPTSAVCGMPMKPAAQFLDKNEGFDRQYYSGYLGPVNFEKRTSIYVNLRCSRIYRNGGMAFAGAGVTENSVAEDEWAETEIKLQTLLSVFDIN